jgi:hypothetical protein
MPGTDFVRCVAKSGIFPDKTIQVIIGVPLSSVVDLTAECKGNLPAEGAPVPHSIQSKVKIKRKKLKVKTSGKLTLTDATSGLQFRSRVIDAIITDGTSVTVFGRGTLGSSGTLLRYRHDIIGGPAPECGVIIQSMTSSTAQGFLRFEAADTLINGKVRIKIKP